MHNYRFELQENDGRWSAHEFQSFDDDDAVRHARRMRTANRCELYQADRWLATFDGAPRPKQREEICANDDTNARCALQDH